jgi:predicted ATPase with chaperone activity
MPASALNTQSESLFLTTPDPTPDPTPSPAPGSTPAPAAEARPRPSLFAAPTGPPTETLLATAGSAVVPLMPSTLEQTGLGIETVLSLTLKTLFVGQMTGRQLSDELKVTYGILEPIIATARAEQLIEVKSASGVGTAGYLYALTDRGRDRAGRFFDVNGYLGPAPVPLDQYVRYVREIAKDDSIIDREGIAAGFTDLIVTEDMLDQLGPAVSTRRAMFLYGPPGNGKSAMSAGIGRALGGAVYMPYAIEIGGQIVTMFDPVTHVPQPADANGSFVRSDTAADPRWIRIRRPVITVGGELTLEQLDLKFNPLAKFYEAPLQLKANCGVMLVDDFGRQRIPASDLLNRWIVPLEARVDYLALHTGRKFEVPFEVLVIFATNLEPSTLADEAFLRRIPYKVHATNPSLEQFSAIFEMVCRKHGIEFDQRVVDHLCREYYEGRGLQMRACHPRDLVSHMVNLCRYRKQPVAITPRLLDEACRTYFLDKPLYGTEARV